VTEIWAYIKFQYCYLILLDNNSFKRESTTVFQSIILPVVSYGCEKWSRKLMKKRRWTEGVSQKGAEENIWIS
jgi:hypothetical protein